MFHPPTKFPGHTRHHSHKQYIVHPVGVSTDKEQIPSIPLFEGASILSNVYWQNQLTLSALSSFMSF
jgi:hypothetical protein